jgi:hypothetical protein
MIKSAVLSTAIAATPQVIAELAAKRASESVEAWSLLELQVVRQ